MGMLDAFEKFVSKQKPRIFIGPAGATKGLTEIKITDNSLHIANHIVNSTPGDSTYAPRIQQETVMFSFAGTMINELKELETYSLRINTPTGNKAAVRHYRIALLLKLEQLRFQGKVLHQTALFLVGRRELYQRRHGVWVAGHNRLICQVTSFSDNIICPCSEAHKLGFMS